MWNDWLSCTAANTTVFTYYFDQMFANAIVPSVSTFYPQLQKTDKQTKCRWIEQTDRFWSQIETLSEHQNAESVLLTSTFIIETFSEHPKQSVLLTYTFISIKSTEANSFSYEGSALKRPVYRLIPTQLFVSNFHDLPKLPRQSLGTIAVTPPS